MSLLPGHLETMRAWTDLVQEVIAVDSHSTDGTLEALQQEFNRPNARVMTHPPGLYQSWNFAIAQCRSRYVYVSTVGDSITRRGIETLCSTADTLNCDVVVSPPQMVNTSGADVDSRWPVHDLAEKLRHGLPIALSPELAFAFAAVNLRRAILGSSASNLYRAEILQRWPFPTDYGTAGDHGWILRHTPHLRLGVVPELFSTFVFHPKSYAKSDYAVDNFTDKCLATVREAMRSEPWPELAKKSPDMGALLDEIVSAWDEFLHARNAVEQLKKDRHFWRLAPGGWKAARLRSTKKARCVSLQRRVNDLIVESLNR